ncbi:MAG: ABC transporter permease [Rhodospirillaceae bacterium]|nr:ABC transporter permease [Rhodospirillaceae bacterium]
MRSVALKMLTGDRAKYLGLVFGIAFATMLMSQQVSIFIGLMARTASQILDVREADLWVMDPRVQYVEEVEPMTATQLWRVRGVEGVAWATPFFKALTVARSVDGVLQQVFILGVDDASLAGMCPAMLMGNAADLKRPDAVVIDRAGHFFIWPNAAVKPGRSFELNDRRAVVVGICEAAAPFTTFPVVFAKYSDALRYVGRTRKPLSYILVRAAAGEDVSALARRIEAQTGLRALTWRQFMWATIDYYLERTGIPVNFGITVALGFIVGAAVAGQTFYIFVLENLRQFGALKAMGVGNRAILGMVLLQALVVAGIGYSLGIALSAAFFEVTGRVAVSLRGFSLPWEVMAGTAGAVLAIILIASFASIRRVLVVDPAIVFRG